MRTVRSVTVIQPTNIRTQGELHPSSRKKRVAAYARVSTNSEEQQTSYDAQVDYYTRHIQGNPDWIFVEVYSDEGISATSTKKRDGFNRMIADALNNKIDLILTKSISRFARNTVDTLTNVRLLKDKNVEVYFEKENIFTMDSKGELLITLLSSLAQEESRNLSENITWGQRKRFADGKVSLPYKRFLGFEKGDDDLPQIVESEAKIVRLIYKMFLEGYTPTGIARYLTEQGIPSPAGKPAWQDSTVNNILTNEKYGGSAILQKQFTVDFLTKKRKVNEGEVPQYYIQHSHRGIVSAEVFDLVQLEMQKRRAKGYNTRTSCLSSRIICGECGGYFGSKVWHSTSKYRRTVWQCNRKFHNDRRCQTPHLNETVIKQLFVEALNHLIRNKADILGGVEASIDILTNWQPLEQKRDQIDAEMLKIKDQIEGLINRNSRVMLDQTEYNTRYDRCMTAFNKLQAQHKDLNVKIAEQKLRQNQAKSYLQTLEQQPGLLTEFDEELFAATVESITIHAAELATIRFKDESELSWPMPQVGRKP